MQYAMGIYRRTSNKGELSVLDLEGLQAVGTDFPRLYLEIKSEREKEKYIIDSK